MGHWINLIDVLHRWRTIQGADVILAQVLLVSLCRDRLRESHIVVFRCKWNVGLVSRVVLVDVWWPLPLVRVQALIKLPFWRDLHLWRELIWWCYSIYSLWAFVLSFNLKGNCRLSLLFGGSVCTPCWLLSPLRSSRRPASFIWSINFFLRGLSSPESRLPNLSKVSIKILFLISGVSTGNSVDDDRRLIILHFLFGFQRADIFEIDHILVILFNSNFERQIPKFILDFIQFILLIDLFEVP